MADFHAAKEISSDLMAVLLSCSVDISPVKDIWYINFVANDHLFVSPTTTINNSLFAAHPSQMKHHDLCLFLLSVNDNLNNTWLMSMMMIMMMVRIPVSLIVSIQMQGLK
jgi:hypothetical protein